MFVRSPRRFAILSSLAFVFIFAFLHHGPWSRERVIERMPLFNQGQRPGHQELLHDTPGASQAHLDDAWQHAVPVPAVKPAATLVPPMIAADHKPYKEPVKEPAMAPTKTKPPPPWVTAPSRVASFIPPFSRPSNMKKYMENMLQWPRPSWDGHWPPFADYIGKAYDPNRWEQFDMDYRVYESGHDKLNKTIASEPIAYKPFPKYNTPEWKKKWHGEYVACLGPRGVPLNESTDDEVQVYRGIPENFPPVYAGGYDVIGLDEDVCFDRYSRYGPYGYGDDQFPEEVKDWKAPATVPEWNEVNWGALQDDCLERNKNRFRPSARSPIVKIPSTVLPEPAAASSAFAIPTDTSRSNLENREPKKKYHHRTAILIRAWTGYNYEENDITAIRAMVSELSLQSGGEYQVYLYVHVKDRNSPIFDSQYEYDRILEENVPEELRDIAILWSESIFPKWYPKVMDWQVYWQQFMCLQWFSLTHPEFDYIWNWETDARYTGHHYHFFEKISEFADKQPRKLLWERNKRYYLPSVHGDYQSFVENTHRDVLNASANSLIPPPVWGPRPWARADPPQKPLGPTPPTTMEEDDFEWGVAEPADFITLLPMWDPRNTTWSYKDKIWNYLPYVRPIFTPEDGQADWFTHPDFEQIDRRTFINTVVRFSKKMLQAMHEENLVGRSMQAEMWPSTVALQHGLKAVYAPHPIFNDRHWPPAYTEAIFDSANTVDEETGEALEPRQGAWTEEADSCYNHDREFNFQGWSWYYASRFPRNLYRRWLNWPIVKQAWGESEKIDGGPGFDGALEQKRMCMPGILLHPVKHMSKDAEKP
ncbi:hypothetical protein P3342_008369 [Pyrenophora teres f. teres]|uniref:DUF3405 domain containing protein n=1 Tax=Pyrenophora teres f. teres (strain 0-1) TaxID=861557 RepID=E3RI84_PYRTT|nr:hypothetical protein PTT_07703 [Pyrenophora teres f. teres 0-1]KAE8829663.1 hypothetical protein HRS9122_09478 [Pyrenophora teres f. teres]KAE8830511.1 hypothetical protein PTNB85_07098 [Pyrenophora teres f. teres]KAK1910490.1 hypothetical protein P3342_008369 [Pyrenophora teres f. teres]